MSLFKSLVLLVFVATSQYCSASQAIDDIQALIATDPDKALQLANELWQGKEVNEANLSSAFLLMNAYIAKKNFGAANELLEQFIRLSDLSTQARAKLLAQKLIIARETKNNGSVAGEVQEGKLLLTELMPYANQPEVNLAIFLLNREIGFNYYFSGSFAEAEPFFMQALAHINEVDVISHSKLLNTIGVVKAQQADLAGGAEYMLKAIELLEDEGMPVDFASYQNLGSLNFMLKKWDKSIEFSQKAISMQSANKDTEASILSNVAAAYVEKGELELAIEYLNKSIEMSTEIGSSTASARNNLGYIYNQIGDYDNALIQLELSKAEFITSDREEELSVTYKSMGDVYTNLQQYEKAAALYEKSYELHQLHDFKMLRVELYPKMIEAVVNLNDFQRAYQLMTEFKTLNDEIINVESTEKVNKLLSDYEVEKRERALIDSELEREKQKNSIELLEHNAAFDEKVMYLMIVVMSGLIVILYLINRSRKFKGRVNQILLDKNQRIEEQHKELLSLNIQLKNQSEIDALTGLKNRRFLTQMIAAEMANKQDTARKWCLIILDLDDFKGINDQYGHQRGDEVLIKFAALLEANKATGDVVARWGGEEFLWLAEIDSINASKEKCDAFQAALAAAPWFRGDEGKVTCSMGFSSFPLVSLNFEDWDAALRLADYALYQAKKEGKNTWCGFEVLSHQIDYLDIKQVDQLLNNHQLKIISKGS